MSDLVQQRKNIIESYNWAGDVKKKTKWKDFENRFLYPVLWVFIGALILFANFILVNSQFDLFHRMKWNGAGLFIAILITFMLNTTRYHFTWFLYRHYHSLNDSSIHLNQESNNLLKKVIKREKQHSSVITWVLGALIMFAGIISYLGDYDPVWEYTWIAFIVFELLYFKNLIGYFQDFKKVTQP